jgi:ubiquinone/menaquinone biosynthesis C-methylase UbiE/uncharacterized protein YbaR (Trm112 family)
MKQISIAELNFKGIKQSFEEKENILALLRRATGKDTNDQVAIQVSYDLQAGSYVEAMKNADYADFKNRSSKEMASIFSELSPSSILEAGIGEASCLTGVVRACSEFKNISFSGFDLSFSRCLYARNYILETLGREISVFVGGLESIPMQTNSIDVVYTAHAIEPNHGREREILRELYRVAQRYVVLFEPAYEFTTDEIRARMNEHGYCRGLADIANDEGWKVLGHRLAEVRLESNPTAVLVIEKAKERMPAKKALGCPRCYGPLVHAHGHYFCEAEGLVYPAIRGIPCLLPSHAIIANKFLMEFGGAGKTGF